MNLPHVTGNNEGCGWAGTFPVLKGSSVSEIVNALTAFVRDSSPEQIRAWTNSIPLIQVEAGKVVDVQSVAKNYSALFEYQLPFGQRKVDVIFLCRVLYWLSN